MRARSLTFIHTHVYSGYFHTDEFSHLINCLADESERQVKAAVCLRCGSSITIISLTKRRKLYASSGGLRRRRREKQAAGHRQPSEKRRDRAERATVCVLYPCSDWPPAKQINLPLKWANQLKHANSAPHFYLVSSSSTLVYINLIWPALKRNLMLVRKQRGFIFGWHTNYLWRYFGWNLETNLWTRNEKCDCVFSPTLISQRQCDKLLLPSHSRIVVCAMIHTSAAHNNITFSVSISTSLLLELISIRVHAHWWFLCISRVESIKMIASFIIQYAIET